MKNFMSLLVLAVVTTSCVNLRGTLDVTETLSVKKKGGFLNLQRKSMNIAPGRYSAELKINGESSVTLEVLGKDGKEIKIPISGEESFNIPANGPIAIKGSTVSQPFDLKGDIATDITHTEPTSGYADCTYTLNETRCEKVCEAIAPAPQRPSDPNRKDDPRGPDNRREDKREERRDDRHDDRRDDNRVVCREVCRVVPVSYNGKRFVESHQRITTRNVNAIITGANSEKALASISASGTEYATINDRVGECR
jgi:hypothetical protein